MHRFAWKRCPYCGDFDLYRSRSHPLSLLDRMCVIFLLQLVRCEFCEQRSYRPIFFHAPEYPYPRRAAKVPERVADTGDKRKSA